MFNDLLNLTPTRTHRKLLEIVLLLNAFAVLVGLFALGAEANANRSVDGTTSHDERKSLYSTRRDSKCSFQ